MVSFPITFTNIYIKIATSWDNTSDQSMNMRAQGHTVTTSGYTGVTGGTYSFNFIALGTA